MPLNGGVTARLDAVMDLEMNMGKARRGRLKSLERDPKHLVDESNTSAVPAIGCVYGSELTVNFVHEKSVHYRG